VGSGKHNETNGKSKGKEERTQSQESTKIGTQYSAGNKRPETDIPLTENPYRTTRSMEQKEKGLSSYIQKKE